jgi:hypothetical protein
MLVLGLSVEVLPEDQISISNDGSLYLTMTLLFSTRQLAIAAILAFILVSFVTLHRFDSAKAVKGFFGKVDCRSLALQHQPRSY